MLHFAVDLEDDMDYRSIKRRKMLANLKDEKDKKKKKDKFLMETLIELEKGGKS